MSYDWDDEPTTLDADETEMVEAFVAGPAAFAVWNAAQMLTETPLADLQACYRTLDADPDLSRVEYDLELALRDALARHDAVSAQAA